MKDRQGEINERLFRHLHNKAQYNEDRNLLRRLAEAREAESYEGVLMTGEQLADLMGIVKDDDGNIPITPFINACMSVDQFDGVQALPREERIRAMRTAFEFLSRV